MLLELTFPSLFESRLDLPHKPLFVVQIVLGGLIEHPGPGPPQGLG